MKREDYTITVKVTVHDDISEVATAAFGNDDEETYGLWCEEPYECDVAALKAALKNGFRAWVHGGEKIDKWLAADDATLTDACKQAMGKAAERNDPRTEKLAAEAVAGHVAELKEKVEGLDAAISAAFCAANRPSVDSERALKDVRSILDGVTSPAAPIVRTQDNVQVGDVRDDGGFAEEVLFVSDKECRRPVFTRWRGRAGEWNTDAHTLEYARKCKLLNPTDADGNPLEASDGDE